MRDNMAAAWCAGRSIELPERTNTLKDREPLIEYRRLEVHCLGRWIWQVHENQYYLGRMILRLDRAETGSLSNCTSEEWASLHENIRLYENLLRELFWPDRFNYSQMGNVYPQLHVQAVPRYSSSRTWKGRTFEDKNWGRNWAPTPRSPLAINETYEFASWLKNETRARLATR